MVDGAKVSIRGALNRDLRTWIARYTIATGGLRSARVAGFARGLKSL